MANFLQAFNAIIIPFEGMYSNDKNDSGGETVWGLTRKDDADWQGWHVFDYFKSLKGFPKNLVNAGLADKAQPYYKKKYWDYASLDKFPSQDLANKIFDISVNMGKYWAIAFLQRSLNVMNHQGKDYADIAVDGIFGGNTLNAVLSCQNLANVLKAVSSLQGARYVALGEANSKLEDFENGWMRRV